MSRSAEDPDESLALGAAERNFLLARDGFYQASVSSTGWPCVQYRGGSPGFLQVLAPTTVGYADLRGNRQYISVGNLADADRVALFFMDYANRERRWLRLRPKGAQGPVRLGDRYCRGSVDQDGSHLTQARRPHR